MVITLTEKLKLCDAIKLGQSLSLVPADIWIEKIRAYEVFL